MILYTIFFFKETELNFFTQKSSNLLANFCANAPIFICFCSRLRLIQIALHVMLWRCAAKNAKANNGEHPKTRRRCYENRPLPKFESKNRLPHKKLLTKNAILLQNATLWLCVDAFTHCLQNAKAKNSADCAVFRFVQDS